MLERASERFRTVLESARAHAVRLRHRRIGSGHLLLGLLDEGGGVAASALRHLGIDVIELKADLERALVPGDVAIGAKSMTLEDDARRAIARAESAAQERRNPYVGTEHLLLGLLADPKSVAGIVLRRRGITRDDAAAAAAELKADPEHPQSDDTRRSRRAPPVERVLDRIGVDITLRTQQRRLPPVLSRIPALERVKALLCDPSRPSVLIRGPRHVGKTSAVFALARDVLIGSVPSSLLRRRLIAIDEVRLLAGCRHRDQLEERFDSLLAEAERARDTLLVFDDIEWLLLADSGQPRESSERSELSEVAARFRGAIESHRIQVLATTTSGSRLLSDRMTEWFACVELTPADTDRALLTLLELREQFEVHHRVTIQEDAIRMAVQLALGAAKGPDLVGIAISLLDESAARLALGALTPPPRLARLDQEIRKLETQRTSAFERQDHSQAARCFEEGRAHRELRDQIERKWRSDIRDNLRVVDGDAVARTWALLGGISGVRSSVDEQMDLSQVDVALDDPTFDGPTR